MALPELFANSSTPGSVVALTTLGADQLSTSSLSFTMAAAAPAALQASGSGQFRAVIDSEIIIFDATAVSTTTWTALTRGAEGSTAATHLTGASVFHYLTAGALSGFSPLAALFTTPTVGQYLTCQFCNTLWQGAAPASLGDMLALPVLVPQAHTFVGIAQKIWVGGSAGSVCRMGIYSDNGAGQPGGLLLDAGTVATTSNSIVTITISQALSAGQLVWLVCVPQVAMPSFVTLYMNQFNAGAPVSGPLAGLGHDSGGLFAPNLYWKVASVTGTLPSSPTWTLDSTGNTRVPNTALLA